MENRYIKRIHLTPEAFTKIAKLEEIKGRWEAGLTLSPQILGRLKKSVLITSTGASTRIEGAKMSDREVERLLRGLKSKKPKGRDAQEVAGYADLLGRIFDHWKALKITEGQILHFHKILLNFSEKDQRHKGRYKTSDNAVMARNAEGREIVIFRPTPPYLVKKEMDDVLHWLGEQSQKEEVHPVILTASFIFEFLAIHPFHDGNGRLSRALTNLLLLKAGYHYIPYVSLEEIIEKRQIEYYLSLRRSQKKHKTRNEDITPWFGFLLDALIEQAQRAMKLMKSEQPEKLLSEKQEEIYKLFRDEPLSVSEIDKELKHKIPQVTIKQALARLVGLKLIERIGVGRGSRYRKP